MYTMEWPNRKISTHIKKTITWPRASQFNVVFWWKYTFISSTILNDIFMHRCIQSHSLPPRGGFVVCIERPNQKMDTIIRSKIKSLYYWQIAFVIAL